jgi:hypothetical protein
MLAGKQQWSALAETRGLPRQRISPRQHAGIPAKRLCSQAIPVLVAMAAVLAAQIVVQHSLAFEDDAGVVGIVTHQLASIKVTRGTVQNEARTAPFEFIESFYNRQRRHSALGYLSPEEYERRWVPATPVVA